MKRVIVAGGRGFKPTKKDHDWLVRTLTSLATQIVVSGTCTGADLFGEKVAEEMGLMILRVPPNWKEFGKQAGPIRNNEMARNADACILFPGGRGTADMERRAKQKGIPVFHSHDSVRNILKILKELL